MNTFRTFLLQRIMRITYYFPPYCNYFSNYSFSIKVIVNQIYARSTFGGVIYLGLCETCNDSLKCWLAKEDTIWQYALLDKCVEVNILKEGF